MEDTGPTPTPTSTSSGEQQHQPPWWLAPIPRIKKKQEPKETSSQQWEKQQPKSVSPQHHEEQQHLERQSSQQQGQQLQQPESKKVRQTGETMQVTWEMLGARPKSPNKLISFSPTPSPTPQKLPWNHPKYYQHLSEFMATTSFMNYEDEAVEEPKPTLKVSPIKPPASSSSSSSSSETDSSSEQTNMEHPADRLFTGIGSDVPRRRQTLRRTPRIHRNMNQAQPQDRLTISQFLLLSFINIISFDYFNNRIHFVHNIRSRNANLTGNRKYFLKLPKRLQPSWTSWILFPFKKLKEYFQTPSSRPCTHTRDPNYLLVIVLVALCIRSVRSDTSFVDNIIYEEQQQDVNLNANKVSKVFRLFPCVELKKITEMSVDYKIVEDACKMEYDLQKNWEMEQFAKPENTGPNSTSAPPTDSDFFFTEPVTRIQAAKACADLGMQLTAPKSFTTKGQILDAMKANKIKWAWSSIAYNHQLNEIVYEDNMDIFNYDLFKHMNYINDTQPKEFDWAHFLNHYTYSISYNHEKSFFLPMNFALDASSAPELTLTFIDEHSNIDKIYDSISGWSTWGTKRHGYTFKFNAICKKMEVHHTNPLGPYHTKICNELINEMDRTLTDNLQMWENNKPASLAVNVDTYLLQESFSANLNEVVLNDSLSYRIKKELQTGLDYQNLTIEEICSDLRLFNMTVTDDINQRGALAMLPMFSSGLMTFGTGIGGIISTYFLQESLLDATTALSKQLLIRQEMQLQEDIQTFQTWEFKNDEDINQWINNNHFKNTKLIHYASARFFRTSANFRTNIKLVHKLHSLGEIDAHDVLDQATLHNMKSTIARRYNLHITSSMEAVKVQFTALANSYLVVYDLPVESDSTKNTIVKINQLPKIEGKYASIRQPVVNFFGVSEDKVHFTPLLPSEAEECKKKKFCKSVSPSFYKNKNFCMINEYFNLNSTCVQQPITDSGPFFAIIDNTTYYTVKDQEEITLTKHCNTNTYAFQVRGQEKKISGTGSFETEPFCYYQGPDVIIRPTHPTLETDKLKILINQEDVTNEVQLDIASKFINLLFEENLHFFILTITILGLIIILLIIVICLCKKRHRNTYILPEVDVQEERNLDSPQNNAHHQRRPVQPKVNSYEDLTWLRNQPKQEDSGYVAMIRRLSHPRLETATIQDLPSTLRPTVTSTYDYLPTPKPIKADIPLPPPPPPTPTRNSMILNDEISPPKTLTSAKPPLPPVPSKRNFPPN